MSLAILASGKLVKDPTKRVSKTGKDYLTFLVAANDESGTPAIVSVVVFDEALIRKVSGLTKGDQIAASGAATLGIWKPEHGEARPNLSIVAGNVLTPYETAKRRKAQTETEANPYVLSNKAVSAMQEAGRLARASDLQDDIPWGQNNG